MSAIWGAVEFKENEMDCSINQSMMNSLKKYKIDRFDFIQNKNAAIGCAIQYIRNNSLHEKLPIEDSEIIFTVDGMLDNRTEVANQLGISSCVPDGKLFYLAYKKWGLKVNDHIRGAYSFAVFDKTNNKLILSTDHISSRVLYYYKTGSRVYFATSLDSIVSAVPEKIPVDDMWISEFLSTPFLSQLQDAHTAPYKGVRLMSTAQIIVFSLQEEKTITFWKPQFTASDKRSDAQVAAELRNIMDTAAMEITDDVEKTAILLSSGMDSTAVGGTVAAHLNKKGKKLYSYTSVPCSEFQGENTSLFLVNESEEVKKICQMHNNIVPTFYQGENNNALTFADDVLHYLEYPYKSTINMTWLHPLFKQIEKDGNTVLLNGSAGNITISFGTVLHYSTTMAYKRKKPITALRALSFQGKKYGYSRKSSIKSWLKSSFPYHKKPSKNTLETTMLNKNLATKYNITHKMIERNQYSGACNLFEYNKQRQIMIEASNMVSIACAETKSGLMGGFFHRDITRDKRVCELCFSQPLERFAKFENNTKQFTTRRLIPLAFGDVLPKSISNNGMTFGVQSADWVFRLRKDYPKTVNILKEAYYNKNIKHYFNKEYLTELFTLAKSNNKEGNNALMQLICNYPVVKFLINNYNL